MQIHPHIAREVRNVVSLLFLIKTLISSWEPHHHEFVTRLGALDLGARKFFVSSETKDGHREDLNGGDLLMQSEIKIKVHPSDRRVGRLKKEPLH